MPGRRVVRFGFLSCLVASSLACGGLLGIGDVTEIDGAGGGADAGGAAGGAPGGRGGRGGAGPGAGAAGAPGPGGAGEGGGCADGESSCAGGVERRCEGGAIVEAACAIECDGAARACLRPRLLGVGAEHACALMGDGSLRCWGSDQRDQLGDGGARDDSARPRPVPAVAGATGLKVNAARTCSLGPAGPLCWGAAEPRVGVDATPKPPSAPGPVVDVALGDDHLCIVVGPGSEFFCGGDNFLSQLGAGDGSSHPGFVAVLAPPSGASRVAAGADHACTLAGGARPFCWGSGAFGQNGDAALRDRPLPTVVPGAPAATDLAPGRGFTCAIGLDGAASCWGRNADGELGRGATGAPAAAAAPVSGLERVVRLAAGDAHACALRDDGAVFCWGSNQSGQLGNGCQPACNAPGALSPAPVAVDLPAAAVELAAGGQTTCALAGDGGLYCWGANGRGQLGNGEVGAFRPRPQPVVWR